MTTLSIYPLDVKGFIVETLRLPPIAKAAYLMILLDYCTKGEPPPDDIETLNRITGTNNANILREIQPLFDVREARWYHKGIEAELARARKITENAHRASKAATDKRKKATGVAAPEKPALEQIGQNQPPAAAPLPYEPEPVPTMEPIPEEFLLSGEEVIESQNRGATVDEIAEWLDYFHAYNTKAGNLAEDWKLLWFRFLDRKIEERDKQGRKAKPRLELSRRAPAPPPT